MNDNKELEQKQQAIDYWKNKAYILANKKGLCYQHEARINEKNFNNTGASFENYIEHGVDCMECVADKLPEPEIKKNHE